MAPILGLALLIAACLWLFLPALHAPFFADDYLFLDQVRGHSLLEALRSPDPIGNFYRPVSRQIWFWLVGRLSGESPQAFHAANVALFLALVTLMFLLGRKLAGARAGVIAAGLVALHYAADVPVLWASGSQDLLAVVGALAATLLHLNGRRGCAAAALLVALLSKEVVLLAPLVILVADHRRGERWADTARRAWPLAASLGVWFVLWVAMPRRHAYGASAALDVSSALAALAHVPQVWLGLEWRPGEPPGLPRVGPPWGPLALVLAAVAAAWPWRLGAHTESGATSSAPMHSGHAVRVGLIWALLAAAPVAVAANIWSAYYYLFAMCGLALALGAGLARLPRGWALLATAALAWGSAGARNLDEFAVPRGAWTTASHINRFYVTRATRTCGRYLADLKRLHPEFPSRSTLFFSGITGNVAFLAGDGPLQRFAYRDPSLRAYPFSGLTVERVHRGPAFFFIATNDSLQELAPGSGLYFDIGFSLVVGDHPREARDALRLEVERDPAATDAHYLLAWVQWALDNRQDALASLARAGVQPVEGPTEEVTAALVAFESRDTLRAIRIMTGALLRHGLDPGAHALLADLTLAADPDDRVGTVEAFAARVLAPEDPNAWRRWAMTQTRGARYEEASVSFERYFALAGEGGRNDAEARSWAAKIRRMLPGGDLAREGLHEPPPAR